MGNKATNYLRSSYQIIEPRKQWALQALPIYGFSGNIKKELKAETGRALSLWGDAGWGELVKKGKYEDNQFDDALVQAAVEMIQRWQPQPYLLNGYLYPCLKTHSGLVPHFANKLANKLNLPFLPVVQKVRQNQLQKSMSNSYQQAHNLDGVFKINSLQVKKGAVLLVDDIVDSRWPFTVVAALLRQAVSAKVFPLALALNSLAYNS